PQAIRISPKLVELEVSGDERVTIFSDGQVFQGVVLEGSDPTAVLGPVEVSIEALDSGADLDFLNCAFESIIPTGWLASGALPISAWIRGVSLKSLEQAASRLEI